MKKVFEKISAYFVASLFALSSFLGQTISTTPVYAANTVTVQACDVLHNGGVACSASTAGGKWYVTFSQNGDWGGNQDFHYKAFVNGKRVYCVQPLRNIISGTGNYNQQDFTSYVGGAEKAIRLQYITSLGYGFNGDYSEEMDFATQIRIWQELGYTLTYIHPEIQAKVNQINERLKIAYTSVDFGTNQVTLKGYGKQNAVTLTDKNGVFQYYKDYQIDGVHTERNGNSLTIWAEEGDSLNAALAYDCFWVSTEATDGSPFVYTSGTSQDVAFIDGKPDPNAVALRVTTVPTGKISINKTIAFDDAADKSLLKDNNISANGIGFSLVAKSDVTLNDGTNFKAGSTVSGLKVENGEEKEGVYYINAADNGLMTISEIPIGSYELVEAVSHEGLVTNTVTYPFTVNNDGSVTWEQEFEAIVNTPTEHQLLKVNTDGGPVYGAHMSILDADGNVVDSWVTSDVEYQIEGLKPGTYTLREDKAPAGYVKAQDITFEVKDDGAVESTQMMDITYEVAKVDQFERLVKDATLQITDKDGNVVDEWITGQNITEISDEIKEQIYQNGTASWEGTLNVTPYEIETVEEPSEEVPEENPDEENTENPDSQPEEQPVTLAETSLAGDQTTADDYKDPAKEEASEEEIPVEEDTMTFTMSVLPESTVNTTPEDTTEESSEDTKDVEVDTTTSPEAYIEEAKKVLDEKLEAGEIEQEIYDKIAEQITAIEEVLQNEESTEDIETLIDELKTTLKENNITVEAAELPEVTESAQFELMAMDANGEAYYFHVDIDGNETHHLASNLVAGESYTLSEVETPDKYTEAQPIEFTVEDNGQNQIVSMLDILTDEVEISKKDATSKEELPGAKLKVTDKNGNVVDEWISTNEPHMISGLIVGEEYTLTEIAAPNGYNFAEAITFTIDDNGDVVQHIDMYDTRKPDVKTGLSGTNITPYIMVGIVGLGIASIIFFRLRSQHE